MPSILAPDCHIWCHAKNCLFETFAALLQDNRVPEINHCTWIFNMISLKNNFTSKYFVKSGLEILQAFWCSQSSIFAASTFSRASQFRLSLNNIHTPTRLPLRMKELEDGRMDLHNIWSPETVSLCVILTLCLSYEFPFVFTYLKS